MKQTTASSSTFLFKILHRSIPFSFRGRRSFRNHSSLLGQIVASNRPAAFSGHVARTHAAVEASTNQPYLTFLSLKTLTSGEPPLSSASHSLPPAPPAACPSPHFRTIAKSTSRSPFPYLLEHQDRQRRRIGALAHGQAPRPPLHWRRGRVVPLPHRRARRLSLRLPGRRRA